ncbi:DUF1798 family protein [Gracilibacillus dipsosauri]|uniref:DUF1798 family protein n=1 Tax=Gracilibacillus dipsosauri TaxID=178340 RepID=UPI00240974C3
MCLEDHINTLEEILSDLKEHYLANEKPENKRDPEFFQYVKEQTNPVFKEIEQWYQKAKAFVQNRSVSVHPQQIESTAENLRLLLLHSYYMDARKKRYMELFQSVTYVFDMLKRDLSTY